MFSGLFVTARAVRLGLLAVALAFGGLAGAARAQPAIEAYAAMPAMTDVSVSDDGQDVAYIRNFEDGSAELIVQNRAGEILIRVDLSDRNNPSISWVSPDHIAIQSLVLESQLVIGREHLPQVDIVNVRTKDVARALRDADHAMVNSVGWFRRGTYRGEPVIYAGAVTTDHSNGKWTYDVYRIDLDSGRGRLHHRGAEDTRGYLIRANGDVVARMAYSDVSGRYRISTPSGGSWRDIFEVRALLDTPGVWGFAEDPDNIMVSVVEGDQESMVEVSLTDGAEREKTALPLEITGTLRDDEQKLVAMSSWSDADGSSYRFLEPDLEAAWTVLKAGLPGRRLSLSSFSDDYKTVVVHAEGQGEPGVYYLYDADTRSVSVLGRTRPGIKPAEVAPVIAFDYDATDGMKLHGYLTLPPGKDATALPVIVFPHGGPAARDYAAFDWWAQAMASRGYAVFQPQFRGSDGFGEAYMQAGYGEWGRKMQSDIGDGLKMLVAQGIVDPARACIVGASYGGYAALAGMTIDSGTYRCAVSVAGVSDLRQMLYAESRDSGFGAQARDPTIRYWNRFMGAEGRNDRTLDERSPRYLVDRVEGPILLIHGDDDTVVPFEQSTLMADALRDAGKPHELVRLDGEDHGLSYPETRLAMLTRLIGFLETHNPPN